MSEIMLILTGLLLIGALLDIKRNDSRVLRELGAMIVGLLGIALSVVVFLTLCAVAWKVFVWAWS